MTFALYLPYTRDHSIPQFVVIVKPLSEVFAQRKGFPKGCARAGNPQLPQAASPPPPLWSGEARGAPAGRLAYKMERFVWFAPFPVPFVSVGRESNKARILYNWVLPTAGLFLPLPSVLQFPSSYKSFFSAKNAATPRELRPRGGLAVSLCALSCAPRSAPARVARTLATHAGAAEKRFLHSPLL